jgi:hypothetical protein
MGLFNRLFGKNEISTEASSMKGRNKNYDAQLEKYFSLRFVGNSWIYDGQVNKDFAAQLSDPKLCLAVINAIRTKLQFDQICIISANPVTIVCNTTPPVCLVTKMSGTGIADLILMITAANGKHVYEYQGAWLLRLS